MMMTKRRILWVGTDSAERRHTSLGREWLRASIQATLCVRGNSALTSTAQRWNRVRDTISARARKGQREPLLTK